MVGHVGMRPGVQGPVHRLEVARFREACSGQVLDMSARTTVDLSHCVRLRRELLEEGYSDQQLRASTRSGVLHRVRQGAYVDGELWRSLSPADQHRVMIRAVLRTSHPSTVVTHVSAAVERGAPVWGIPLTEVHTTRTDGKGGRREAGVVHHRGELQEEHVEVINGIRVSTAARCAIEVSTMAGVEQALVTVNGMLHQRMLTQPELEAMAADLKHWPDTLGANLVIRLCDARFESPAETRTDALCRAQHLPRPEPQVAVYDERGELYARVDFAWVDLGVFLEVDGNEKYEIFRREGESLDAYLMREKRREERICQLTGWVCIRIGWADLERPAITARRIRAVLESRQRPSA